jgi:AcrR family transcriptional regulator
MPTKRRPAVQDRVAVPPGRVGRPPRLSREQIVAVSVALMREHPHEALTMANVAAAAGATPMAIYRHVRDREDLLHAVLEHVLEEVDHQIPEDADWREQIRVWMRGVHDHLIDVPECLGVLRIDSATSPAWLRSVAPLVAILQRAGLSGVALTEAMLWVSTSTVGFARMAIKLSPAGMAGGLRDGLARMPKDDAVHLRRLVPHVDRVFAKAFDITIERTIAGVEPLVDAAH